MTATLLFCVLLAISNMGIGGPAGRIFASVFFGLFGLMEYLFPVLLFLLTAFFIANRGNSRRRGKLISYFLFFVFVCAFVHMLTVGYTSATSLSGYYSNSSISRSGGGMCGGFVVFFVGKAFGKYGCYIVSVFGMIISLCFATQRPLVSDAAEKGFLAKERLQAMRDRSLEKRRFIPYDDAEFDSWDEEEDFEDYEEEDFEDEEIRPVRRSGNKTVFSVPINSGKTGKEKSRKGKHADSAGSGEQLSFSDSFLYSLDRREQESQNNRDTAGMSSQELFELFDPEEEREAAERRELHFNGIQVEEPVGSSGPGISGSGRSDTRTRASGRADSIWGETAFSPDEDTSFDGLTVNRSEGAGALEKEQAAAAYNAYEELSDSETAQAGAEEEGRRRKKKNSRSSEAEIAQGVETITDEIQEKEEQMQAKPYQLPPLDLLKKGSGIPRGDSTKYLKETAAKLEQVMHDFGVNVQVTDVSCGPSITRYEVKPEQGVKVSRIVNLADDIKLYLAATNIRIEAPIPGKAAVGIEVPNKTVAPVLLRDLLESTEFKEHPSRIAFAVGKDIAGKTVVTDIARMPHLLIAGATGSGKSVCINTLIMSILYKASPDEVKLLMIDPKVVELSVYNGIPHLAIPVVTDPKKAAGALNWAVAEMSDRYNKFAEYGVRDVAGYNAKVDALKGVPEEQKPKKMPQIVIIVDELADLMMVAPGEVEDAICRLAQLARAAGIHLIIATQRPSVNVVTGLIKANMPSRIALSVASGVDSRTILDMNGAEKLLGHGDMLFYPQGYTKPARVQGGFVSDEEISEVVNYLSDQHGEVTYDTSIEEKINSSSSGGAAKGGGSDQDDLFIDAAKLIVDKDKASIGMLQRQFKIGFNRAARIMDQLCDAGVVGAEEGTKPRKVLLSKEQLENYLEEGRL